MSIRRDVEESELYAVHAGGYSDEGRDGTRASAQLANQKNKLLKGV
jgi:hypothetical protein